MANFKFLAQTALRDSRKNRGRLFLFMSSIVLGIAALVAINSFNYNLVRDIDLQAASLLGADLAVTGNRPLTDDLVVSLDSLPGESAMEKELFSMSYLPKVDVSQFVQIKALEGGFPFYGKIKTSPLDAGETFKKDGSALVDASLMSQHQLEVGDSIQLGERSFVIGGRLESAFASNNMAAGFAPPVYIAMDHLAATELVQPGSMVNYSYFYKLPQGFAADDWEDAHDDQFRNNSMRIQTISGQKENLKDAFGSLNTFLNLVALVSLLLGCIGVASSVFIYIKSKVNSIAVFRCLGMSGQNAFLIYFIQIMSLGLIGVVVGALLGSSIQLILPKVFSDFLPFEVSTTLSWKAIGEGLTIGALITALFSLIPLLKVRKVSPLRTLRASLEEDIEGFDPWAWLLYAGVAAALFGFLWWLTGSTMQAGIFVIGLGLAFAVLFLVTKLIVFLVKTFFPRSWSFVARQGLSNLFRPNNQTQSLVLSIGLGTAILTTLFIVQGLLLTNVAKMDAGNQPNMILYGIEQNQIEGINKLTQDFEMPVVEQVPIVTMRIAGWQGKSKAEWLLDSTRTAERWAFNREARVTFRDTLDVSEKLISGQFPHPSNSSDSIFISMGDSFAESMGMELGDEIEFNVQGMRLKTYLGSLRKIDFANMRTRFFILFPTGVLEDAPQFHVLVTKSPDTTTTADYRNAVVKAFPNISVIDLGSILTAVSDIVAKVSYVIQFMAAFSILTGIIVLISSLLLSKVQRIRESVLLRTIGASRKQILLINATEYTFLGVLCASTGIGIAVAASWLLATYELDLVFSISWAPLLVIFLLVVLVIVSIGVLNSREVLNKPPLEVLRKES